MFTNLVRWHTGAVSFPLSDVILAQLACPLSDIMFCLHSGITNLFLYKHWVNAVMVTFLAVVVAIGAAAAAMAVEVIGVDNCI